MKILAVDDDAIILEILSESIQSFSTHQVEFAKSGEEALVKIASSSSPYDCFLLDIQMPSMTGIELCAKIREKPDYVETPIVMVTAMSEKRYIDNSFIAGATDYVTKPFDLIELKARLNVAEKLSKAVESSHQTARYNVDPIAAPVSGEGFHKVSDVIPILDVNGVLTTSTFMNYLGQMKRGQFFRTSFLAVKVVNIEAIHSHSVGDEFQDLIFDIAEAVSSVLRQFGGIITYFGSGIFCCAINSNAPVSFGDLPTKLEDAVYSLYLCYGNGTPVSVEFTIGAPVSSGFFAKSSAAELIQKAVRNLEEHITHQRMTSLPGHAV